ncbi:MAG: lipopolysaccharide biosynthesis protein [Candidatus Binatia bacterium]
MGHSAEQRLLSGTALTLAAEALFPLSGLVTAIILTRYLGTAGYGILVLVVSMVAWVEVVIAALFSRATIKLTSELTDWHPIGVTVLRLSLGVSSGVTIVLWLGAPGLAALLHEPEIVFYLCLFACDIPIFAVNRAHDSILTGIGDFHQRAITRALRWTARLVFIVAFVAWDFAITGAIFANIGASLIELLVLRRYVRLSLFASSSYPTTDLWRVAAPLFSSTLFLSLHLQLDQLLLKMLGGTTAQVGIYGAARNLASLPGLLSVALTPLLVSTLSHLLHNAERTVAQRIARNALRLVLALFPFAGLVAGGAPAIIGTIFGASFSTAAPLLAVLIFGALALVLVSVGIAILTAGSMYRGTLVVTSFLVPLTVLGSMIIIPQYSSLGAALVWTGVSISGALLTLLVLYYLWGIAPPLGTFARSVFLTYVTYVCSVLDPVSGLWFWGKFTVLGLAIPGAYLLLGECSREERRMLAALARRFFFRYPTNITSFYLSIL